MRKFILITVAAIIGPGFAGGVAAQGAQNGNRNGDLAAFIGLWQAIDSYDGSTQFLSIICESSRSCDVRLNDTAFTLSCPNQIGFARGIGSIDRGVLGVQLELHCANPYGGSTPSGSQYNEFVLDRKSGTLTNVNDDPVPVANVFLRITG